MKKIILPLLTSILLVSCTRDNINTDPNSAYTSSASVLLPFAQKALSDHITTPNVNVNNTRLLMQYWTETIYTQESNYDYSSRSVSDQIYGDNYVSVLNNLQKAKNSVNDYVPTIAEAPTWPKVKANQLAIIDILMVYTFQNLVDTFGNVPYTEANKLSTTLTPKYEDAETIYGDLIKRIDNDINSLDTSFSSALSTADLYYGGDVSKWKKFGSSILLKLGIALADKNPTLAQSTVNKAKGYGLITASADNCQLVYLASPNYNPLYANLVASGRTDYVGGKTIVDYMLNSGDTRISKYFQKSEDTNAFVGCPIGAAASTVGGTTSLSLPGAFGYTTTTPGILLNSTEVNFYLAEAESRWGSSVVAANYYGDAIKASFSQWGLAADATAYLAAHPYTANWKKTIGEQAWVAMYNQPYTSWNFWRRLDFPQLTPAVNAVPASEGKIPVRMVYSTREASTNGANVAAAATAIGGDKMSTRIFWDVN